MPPKKVAAKCLYDILELQGDCEDDAVKKAYRKMALQWHPDKNQHRVEEAIDRFKEIQNAYEILSDKQERAWYDSHREQILKSGERHQAGGGSSSYESSGGFEAPDDEEELFEYFSSGCYSGYGEGSKAPTQNPVDSQGFYAVYATLFAKLAKQESEAWEKRGAAGDGSDDEGRGRQPPVHPGFGMGSAGFAEVNAFYGFWGTFATAKDFSWADSYNLAAAPNRPVRRRMEEENGRLRKAARREFNAKVRDLVAFIKKRDKRVAKFQAEDSARRVMRAAEEDEKRKREKEERMAKAAEYEEADWIRNSQVAGHDSDSSADVDLTELYCIVCEKSFKSDKQFENHERSKKHQEKLSLLKAHLEAEEAEPLSVIHEEDEQTEDGDERAQRGGSSGVLPTRSTGGGCRSETAQPQYFGVNQASQGQGQGKKKNKKKKASRCQEDHADSIPRQAPTALQEADVQAHTGRDTGKQQGQGIPTASPAHKQQGKAAATPQSYETTSEEEGSAADSEGGDDEDAMLARMMAGSRAQQAGRGGGKQQQAQRQQQPDLQSSSSEEEQSEEGTEDDEDVMLARMMASSTRVQKPGHGCTPAAESSPSEEDSEGDDDEDAMLARMMASAAVKQQPAKAEQHVVEASIENQQQESSNRDDASVQNQVADAHAAGSVCRNLTGGFTARRDAAEQSSEGQEAACVGAGASTKNGRKDISLDMNKVAVQAPASCPLSTDDTSVSITVAAAPPPIKRSSSTATVTHGKGSGAVTAAFGSKKPGSRTAGSGDTVGSGDDSSEEGGKKGSKRKQKAAVRKAQASAADAVVAGKAATACGVCGVECGTRNKLFAHIKETGHAVLRA